VKTKVLDVSTRNDLIAVCKEEAFTLNIVAALCYDIFLRSQDKKRCFNILLILESPKIILKYRSKPIKEGEVNLLIVDEKTFEKDVETEWLGGLLTENMLMPYEPLINEDFLWQKEVQAKKKLITEDLDNLVVEYPEICHDLLIKPEYFMFEAMARKASLYPPIMYKFMKVFEDNHKIENLSAIQKGFYTALKLLEKEGSISYFDGYIKVTAKYVRSVKSVKKRTLLVFKIVRNMLLRHSLEIFPKMMRSLLEDYRLYIEYLREPERAKINFLPELEDTKKHVFIPTSSGLIQLSDKVTIEDFAKKEFPEKLDLKVNLEKIGGVLNAVYLLRIPGVNEEKRIVVKVFKNWYGWKWFPLKLWTFGTRGFNVLGKSRMEMEYTMNRYMSENGFNVPHIIYMSLREKLIFQEYIEGENLSNIIKKIYASKQNESGLVEIVRRAGNEIAKVHSLEIALGDCKPENILVTKDEKIWFVDLEQAEKGGDQAWDLAEFLYYSGHYGSFSSIELIQKVTEAFIEGYIESGGKLDNVRRVGSPRYIKVFSFFTSPHIIVSIFNVCKGKLKNN